MTTGLELKLERIGARVKAVDLAHELGVSRQRVSAIEALGAVPTGQAERYRDALASVTRALRTRGAA